MTTHIVSGSSGFIGSALVAELSRRGLSAFAASREELDALLAGAPSRSLRQALPESVFHHLAAVAHRSPNAVRAAEYDAVNRVFPVELARAARDFGARRFVFVSTAKVLGDVAETPLDESAPLAPPDAYSRAKAGAEAELLRMSAPAAFDVVVLRPPLVYGPGVKANFRKLLRLAAAGWPLPLGRVNARRSFVHVGNLVHAMLHVAEHQASGGHVFHVTDGRDMSVTEVLRVLASGMDTRCRLLPVPVRWLRAVGRLAGRGADVDRLVLPFRLDSRKLEAALGWGAPIEPEAGLRATAAWFVESGQVPHQRPRLSRKAS